MEVHATLLSNIASFHSVIFSDVYSGSRIIVSHVSWFCSIGWYSYRYGYGMLEEKTCSLMIVSGFTVDKRYIRGIRFLNLVHIYEV